VLPVHFLAIKICDLLKLRCEERVLVHWACSKIRLLATENLSDDDIVKKMKFAYKFRKFNFQKLNKMGLISSGEWAKSKWLKYFEKH
jgi:hypothetical protein